MMLNATVTAFDTLDAVHVTANVYCHDGVNLGRAENVYHTSVTIRGRGEDDHRRWLRDALVALAETL